MRHPVGLFMPGGICMTPYPKKVLSIQQQYQTYIDAGMTVPCPQEAMEALSTIGYYRLRGYSFHLYDPATKKYQPNTSFADILALYRFDTELSHLLFSYLSAVEVALRTRLIDALLIYGEPLVLNDKSPAASPLREGWVRRAFSWKCFLNSFQKCDIIET